MEQTEYVDARKLAHRICMDRWTWTFTSKRPICVHTLAVHTHIAFTFIDIYKKHVNMNV